MNEIRETAPYDEDYYRKLNCDSVASARVLVPYFRDALHPASVLDVGCGQGAWLAEWLAGGEIEVAGVDGPWVLNF